MNAKPTRPSHEWIINNLDKAEEIELAFRRLEKELSEAEQEIQKLQNINNETYEAHVENLKHTRKLAEKIEGALQILKAIALDIELCGTMGIVLRSDFDKIVRNIQRLRLALQGKEPTK